MVVIRLMASRQERASDAEPRERSSDDKRERANFELWPRALRNPDKKMSAGIKMDAVFRFSGFRGFSVNRFQLH
jgi:hypothetical protein